MTLFCDNWFTSHPLSIWLYNLGIGLVGPTVKTVIGMPALLWQLVGDLRGDVVSMCLGPGTLFVWQYQHTLNALHEG